MRNTIGHLDIVCRGSPEGRESTIYCVHLNEKTQVLSSKDVWRQSAINLFLWYKYSYCAHHLGLYETPLSEALS